MFITDQYPRIPYLQTLTPIDRADNINAMLDGPELYIKRDDMLGLTGGGNKTRKLEFLMADAKAKGADTIITVGAVQSNHCRITLAAAVKEGLKCRLVLEERVPNSWDINSSGNNFLFKMLGVEKVYVSSNARDVKETVKLAIEETEAEGRNVYFVPGGGSNPIGMLGYMRCVEEIIQQQKEMGIEFTDIVVSSGSGGTHAGILAGVTAYKLGIPVTGISTRGAQAPQIAKIDRLVNEAIEAFNLDTDYTKDKTIVFDGYVGEGYGLATKSMTDVVKLFATKEGIMLDPVYTGKTVDGMMDLIKQGYFAKDAKILFIHTGGFPSIFAYTNFFDDVVYDYKKFE